MFDYMNGFMMNMYFNNIKNKGKNINKYKNMYAYYPFILLVLSVIIVSLVYVCGKIKMKSKKI